MTGVRINWIDSQTIDGQWYHKEEVTEKNHPTPVTITRGELIHETPTMIYVAQNVDDELCRSIIKIPKGCILKQKKIP